MSFGGGGETSPAQQALLNMLTGIGERTAQRTDVPQNLLSQIIQQGLAPLWAQGGAFERPANAKQVEFSGYDPHSGDIGAGWARALGMEQGGGGGGGGGENRILSSPRNWDTSGNPLRSPMSTSDLQSLIDQVASGEASPAQLPPQYQQKAPVGAEKTDNSMINLDALNSPATRPGGGTTSGATDEKGRKYRTSSAPGGLPMALQLAAMDGKPKGALDPAVVAAFMANEEKPIDIVPAPAGFSGTTSKPTMFLTSEFNQPEDVNIRPRAGGLPGGMPRIQGGGTPPAAAAPAALPPAASAAAPPPAAQGGGLGALTGGRLPQPALGKPGGEGTISPDLQNIIDQGLGGSIDDPGGQQQAQQDIIDKGAGTGNYGGYEGGGTGPGAGGGLPADLGPNNQSAFDVGQGPPQGQSMTVGMPQAATSQFNANVPGLPTVGDIAGQVPGQFSYDPSTGSLPLLGRLQNQIADAVNQSSAARGAFGSSANQNQILEALAPLALQTDQQAFNQQLGGFGANLQRAGQLGGLQAQGFGQAQDISNANLNRFLQQTQVNENLANVARAQQQDPLNYALQFLGLGQGGNELQAALGGLNQSIGANAQARAASPLNQLAGALGGLGGTYLGSKMGGGGGG